jgi:hypothetical protein
MHYLKQPFFVNNAFKAEIVVRSEKNFNFQTFTSESADYSSLNIDTYLGFEVRKFIDGGPRPEKGSAWFTFHQFYALLKVFKNIAKKLEENPLDFFHEDEEGNYDVTVEGKQYKFLIEGINGKTILVRPAVIDIKKDNTQDLGIKMIVENQGFDTFFDIDTFISFTFALSQLNLLQNGQLLAQMYYSQKLFRAFNSLDTPVEES